MTTKRARKWGDKRAPLPRARQMEPAPLLMRGYFLEECMSKLRLTPAQRTMLHNAVNGKPLLLGLTRTSVSHRTHSTAQALHRAGMLQGVDHKPTAAGISFFTGQSPS